ncbi:type II secretion system inner membrane protein GspF [Sphingorhabdus contaminans]|jgi:general secretion pathway protein F|uniref:General secretion pathway protein F n=1 Tax=Sphingorhabdus contaminans TaxID=1343899 RepID=A0A553WHW4_9SPHN|nr:type II secretion system inner membrane protein GspF [Sphingorhabdus contaminans]TSB04293.1 type II secretion system protein GspF [Sphingorhabdus contaminans]
MPEFAYQVIDTLGRDIKGKIHAADDEAARAALAKKSYYVVKLDSAAARQSVLTGLQRRRRRLSTKQLTLFTRQFSSLIQVSPLEEAIRTISRQSEQAHVRDILGNVHTGVVEGQRLSEAMRREASSFPALYRAMIAAGEGAGTLSLISERLASLLERQAEMRGKIIGALAYPAVLSLVAILVVMGLMVSVVPRVVEQFDNVDQQLPLLTRIVIGLSTFLASYWWVLLLVIMAFAMLFWRALQQPQFRLFVDRNVLAIPVIGKLLRNLHAARMARTLSTMVASRLPLLEGLRLTGGTIRNKLLLQANDDIVEAVRSGGSLSGAMRASGVFPPLLVYLTASGESAGQLELMLERASEYLEREFDNFTSAALSLLEPLIIVAMGGVVAIIILAILLPILQLQNLTGI